MIEVKKAYKFSQIVAVFLRYSVTQKGYKMFGVDSKEFIVSRDVMFKEDVQES